MAEEQSINRRRSTHWNATHGLSGSPEYSVWCRMKKRCYDEECKDYPNYGGRGIRVCDEWLASFDAFLAHVGPRPTAKHSIDRYPNNDGNYEPGNVRWATRVQQARNMRTNRVIEHGGEKRTMTEWAEVLGIKHETLIYRVRRYGVDEAFALAAPTVTEYRGVRRGADVPWASLTDADVVRIRRDRAAGVSCRVLAEELGVPKYIVERAASRQTYKHVT